MRLRLTLILSISLHLLFSASLPWLAYWFPDSPPPLPEKPIEVELVPPIKKSEKEKQQIVTQTLAPDPIKTPVYDDPLAYLSQQTQRVKEQVRALQSGLTKNRGAKATNETKTETAKNSAKSKDPRTPGGLDPFLPEKSVPSSALQTPEQGISTLAEDLSKDLPVGNLTVLNTDQFTFYSFYNRVNELTYTRWAEILENVIRSTDQKIFAASNGRPWVTDLDIWLKPNGEFHSAHLLKESGIRRLDRAAIQAFVDAKFFPNPPKEKVEDDGFIHLRYRFNVHYNPKVLVQ